MRDVELPPPVLEMGRRGPAWARWVERLPGTAQQLLAEWALTPDGAALSGHCSLVLPARTASGEAAVLKLAFPEEESEHEHIALQHWAGRGAVRLLRAEPHRRALLLERLRPADLTSVAEGEACEVVAGLYSRLHRPAPRRLRTLSGRVTAWSARLSTVPRGAPVPHRLVQQAQSIARTFQTDPDTDGVVVHMDLHYENVLGGDPEPWLAIDPKPLSGDPHVEPAPMLWNRWAEVVASGNVRSAVRRRFHTLVDGAELDEARARDWVVLREVVNAVEELDVPAPRRDRITTSIAIAKAVQD